jgi:hypothetical protein
MSRPRNRCETCCYWSDLLARSEGGDGLQAVCLCIGGPRYSQYTKGAESCEKHTKGEPIDLKRTA